jgi:hypothetical protein
VRLSPLVISATNWPVVPASDYSWVWSIWSKANWRGKPKSASVPLFSLQIKHDLTWDRARVAAVESRWLSALDAGKPLPPGRFLILISRKKNYVYVRGDSKLLSGFPWSIIIKPEKNRIKLLMEYKSVTQKVLFANAVLAALMSWSIKLHFHIPQAVLFCSFRFENYRPWKHRQ